MRGRWVTNDARNLGIEETPQSLRIIANRRPFLQKGISEDRFLTFERQGTRYKNSTGMQEEEMIRIQLLA